MKELLKKEFEEKDYIEKRKDAVKRADKDLPITESVKRETTQPDRDVGLFISSSSKLSIELSKPNIL